MQWGTKNGSMWKLHWGSLQRVFAIDTGRWRENQCGQNVAPKIDRISLSLICFWCHRYSLFAAPTNIFFLGIGREYFMNRKRSGPEDADGIPKIHSSEDASGISAISSSKMKGAAKYRPSLRLRFGIRQT